jgi:DNA-binding MltR family transcriptional regulator
MIQPLNEKESERRFHQNETLIEFAKQFGYEEPSDRAVVIVGHAFLDMLLRNILIEFLIDDEKEVERLLHPDGALGTYGSRVTACYCLGLIDEIVKTDLRLVGKIRNQFAHDLHADFSDQRIGGWCKGLRWHREFYMVPHPGATDRDLYQVGVNQLVCHLQGIPSIALGEKRTRVLHT